VKVVRHVIVVAQRKGGVGKTTLSISIAAELHKRGLGVELIDSDPQRSAVRWAELGKLKFPVHDLALDQQPVQEWVQSVARVATERVVIDTAPNDRCLGAAITIADLIVVPCTPSGLDLDSTARTLDIINAVRTRRRSHLKIALVPNRADRRTLEGRQLVEELEEFKEPIGPSIGDRIAFVRAFTTGQSVDEFAPGQAPDREIHDLTNFLERMMHGPA
jgi:chromosome partitioning protein